MKTITNPDRHFASPRLAAVALFALLATVVSAQTNASANIPPDEKDVVKLEEFEVTTGSSRITQVIDRIPGSIRVLDNVNIQDTLSFTEDATAVLSKLLPGYSESTQALTAAGETLRGRRPLRLFDGIPMSSPLRETDRTATFTDMETI